MFYDYYCLLWYYCPAVTDTSPFTRQIKAFWFWSGLKKKNIWIKQKSSFLMCERTEWGDHERTGCDAVDTPSLDSGILVSRVKNEFFVSWVNADKRAVQMLQKKKQQLLVSEDSTPPGDEGLLTFNVVVRCFHQIFQVLMWQTLSHRLIHTHHMKCCR